jgi:hypothetical protein
MLLRNARTLREVTASTAPRNSATTGPARPAPELDHVRTHHRVRQLQQRAAVNFRRCGVLRIVRGHEPAFPRVCGAPMNDGSENIRPVASRWTHPRHRRGRTASRPANVPSQLAPGRRKRRDEERATANSRSAADRVSTHSIWCSRLRPAVCRARRAGGGSGDPGGRRLLAGDLLPAWALRSASQARSARLRRGERDDRCRFSCSESSCRRGLRDGRGGHSRTVLRRWRSTAA